MKLILFISMFWERDTGRWPSSAAYSTWCAVCQSHFMLHLSPPLINNSVCCASLAGMRCLQKLFSMRLQTDDELCLWPFRDYSSSEWWGASRMGGKQSWNECNRGEQLERHISCLLSVCPRICRGAAPTRVHLLPVCDAAVMEDASKEKSSL